MVPEQSIKTQIDFYDYMGKQYCTNITRYNVYDNCNLIIFRQKEHAIKSVIIDMDENTIFIRAYRTTKD